MKVYIDLVFIINYIFDFLLLLSVNYILKRNTKLTSLLLGSLTGSITLIILFIKISTINLLIFKFLISILMILVTFGYKNIHYLTKNITYFYLVSILLGGGIYFLNNQFTYQNDKLLFNKLSLSISYTISITILGIFIFYKYLHCLSNLKTNYNNYYPCKIYFTENDYIKITAFLDTGNKIIDPYSKKSIILLDSKLHNFTNQNPLYVPFNSLNNNGLLKCYKAHKIEIEGRCCTNFLIGISDYNFNIDGINCIINNKIMEELK